MVIKIQIVGQEDLIAQIKLLNEQLNQLNKTLSVLVSDPVIKIESKSLLVPKFNVSWSK